MSPLLAALAIAAQAPPARDFAWYAPEEGRSADYGDEANGHRALRVECRAGTLFLLGPAGPSAMPAVPIQVTFRRGAQHATLLGVVVETEEELSFEVPVGASELPLAALIAGETLTVDEVDIPGSGAPAVLAPLVAGCRR